MVQDPRIMEILREAKKLAQEYHALSGKPLGITGEVAEYEAARILGVELTPARQPGYDATEKKKRHPPPASSKGPLPPSRSQTGTTSRVYRYHEGMGPYSLFSWTRTSWPRKSTRPNARRWSPLFPRLVRRLGTNGAPWVSENSRQLGPCDGGSDPHAQKL
jgi:hypothetical protein